MSINLKGLKAILFDLGGVVIELHYENTARQLADKAGVSVEDLGELLVTSPVLKKFEVGVISASEFRQEVCDLLKISLTSAAFDSIWNALLGEISLERIQRISALPYNTMILSNTNSIHERAFNQILARNHGLESLHELVDSVYFSHKISHRKPDEPAYKTVLAQEALAPEEILFIDDRLDNIQAAENLGFRVFQNKRINDWLALF